MRSEVPLSPRFYKLAATIIQMGTPAEAGKGIADIVKFLMQRISPGKRPTSLAKLRQKIWNLNEVDIAAKKTPATASLGQSLTFIKTILNGHNPAYIRQVLTHIVQNLY